MISIEPSNGSYVTWRELGLKVDPLERKLDEVATTVNGIALSLAHDDGAEAASKGFLAKRQVLVGLTITALTSSTGAAIFTLVTRRHG